MAVLIAQNEIKLIQNSVGREKTCTMHIHYDSANVKMSKRQSKHASKAAPSSTGERKPTRAIEGADEDTLENSLAVLEVECMMKRGHL